jgi:AcrR family transcriptional regulator
VTAIEPRAVDGRVPGRRGLATRQRLLDATASLLDARPYREVRVVDIAREAGTSPATFYQYFPEVETAVLALAAGLSITGGDELERLVRDAPWAQSPDDAAQLVADGYLAFFERHRSLLSVIDLAALEGDSRFRTLRTQLLNRPAVALADIARSEASGLSAAAIGGVLSGMLAHVAAHRRGFGDWGVAGDELREALAALVRWGITGQ